MPNVLKTVTAAAAAAALEIHYYTVAENHTYFTRAATREMLRRNIYVADVLRLDDKTRNRAYRTVDGRKMKVIESATRLLEGLKVGDYLYMLVREEGVIYRARVSGPATWKLVNITQHSAGQFYSSPTVLGARRASELRNRHQNLKFEFQVPVERWERTTEVVERQPYATIQQRA